MADPFIVVPEMRAKYAAQFGRMNPVNGFITGDQARGLFLQSGLPGPVLAQIWQLADVDADGKLDVNEFSIAFHLIALRLKGIEPPPTLPPSLRALITPVAPVFQQSMASQPPMIPPAPAASVPVPGPGRPAPPSASVNPGRPPIPSATSMSAVIPTSRSGSLSGGEWAVTTQAQKKYREQFSMVDSGRTGFVTGVQARGILMQSGLPQPALAQIWNLSDVNHDGKLSVEEFILAMFLVERTRSGAPLPPILPPELVPPSFRSVPQQQPLSPPQQVQNAPIPTAIPHGGAPPRPAPPPGSVPGSRRESNASVSSRGYTSPPSAVTPSSAEWAIPQVSRVKFSQQFNAVDVNRTGYMTGAQARNVLVQSGLPQQQLAQIWNLSDIDTDGRLSVEEFILTMHLIEHAKSGKLLPNVLPLELVPPSFRRKPSVAGSASNEDGGAVTASAAAAVSALTEWAIPQQSKLKYTQMFNTHDRSRHGYLTGVQARGILVQTGLATDMLAQVWNLSDVDSSGRLSCEEFIVAMHLIDMVRAGDPLPATLPNALVPPSFRRKRSVSAASVTAATETAVEEPQSPARKGSVTTFEDKRKENFDKGQAVLDRKRQALVDQQRREQEDRERKEREEQSKRDKVRFEMERRRQEEIERQQQKQREIEAEKEEARRKQLEQREAARREMERQRMLEWEAQRTQELQLQKQKVMEALAQLKSKKKTLAIEAEGVNNSYNQWQDQVNEWRDKVQGKKSEIDAMRGERDAIMRVMNATNVQLKTLNEKQLYIEREKTRIAAELKQIALQAAAEAGVSGDTSQIALQNKAAAINQLKSQLENLEKDKEQKQKDLDASRQLLTEIKVKLTEIEEKTKSLKTTYSTKLAEAREIKNELYHKAQTFDPNSEWETSGPASIIGAVSDVPSTTAAPANTSDKTQYHAVYEFEPRNPDELHLMPGDVVWVSPEVIGESGWLQGECNGTVGWFPEAYVELVGDESAPAAPTDNYSSVVEEDAWGASESVTSPKTIVAEPPSNGTSQSVASDGSVSRAIAIYAWQGKESIHLSFSKNDIIIVKEQQDEWWMGESNGVSGWFPKSYVTLCADAGPVDTDEWTVAVYPFEGQESGDLAFEANELIRITKKEGEWWTGEISADRIGVFPSNYVRPAEADEIVSYFCVLFVGREMFYYSREWNEVSGV